jgi:hypothetical protein
MKIFAFQPNGNSIRPSFGNNLLIYFAVSIIRKEYGHTLVNTQEELHDPITVDYLLWKHYADTMKPRTCLVLDMVNGRDVHMSAYFQDSRILFYYREYLKSLINRENNEIITPPSEPRTVKISDIANTQCLTEPDPQDIVLHIRLDDFQHAGGRSEIVHPEVYFGILDSLERSKIIIVTDKIRHPFEQKYISLFMGRYKNVEVRQGHSFLEDFVFMTKAKRSIVSNSSFSWLSTFLSDASEIHIILNEYRNEQVLGEISADSKVYKIKYITTQEIMAMA